MPRGKVLLGILVMATAGCATPQLRNDQESWFCERTPDGRDWTCSQQRQRNGGSAVATRQAGPARVTASRQAALNVETGTATVANEPSGATEQIPGSTRTQLVPQQRERSANRWNTALPALSAGVAEVPPVSESKPADREPRKPPPEPEPVFARWEKAVADADAKAVSEPRVEEVHEQLPQSEEVLAPPAPTTVMPAAPIKRRSVPAVGAVPEPGPTKIRDRRTYTVQIGAFKSDRAARAYIAQHNLGDLPTLALQRESQDPHQYILVTFGRFASVRSALEAWHRSGAPSDLEIWVRPTNTAPPAPPEAAPAAVISPAS